MPDPFLIRLLVLPVMASVFLAAACLVTVLASPRVFRRFVRRLVVAALLFAYIVLMLIEAPRIEAGLWHVDALTVGRWFASLLPWALALCLMRRMEDRNTDAPMRGPLWLPPEAWRG